MKYKWNIVVILYNIESLYMSNVKDFFIRSRVLTNFQSVAFFIKKSLATRSVESYMNVSLT